MLPATIYAGASWEATYSLTRKPADGWASRLVLRNKETQEVYQVGAVPDGQKYKLAITPTISAAWAPGEYTAHLYASKTGEDEHHHSQSISILPNPAGNAVTDPLRDELADVNAAISGVLAGKGVQSYQFETAVGRRSADRMSLEELRKHRDDLMRRIENRDAKAEGRKSRHGWRKIQGKFVR